MKNIYLNAAKLIKDNKKETSGCWYCCYAINANYKGWSDDISIVSYKIFQFITTFKDNKRWKTYKWPWLSQEQRKLALLFMHEIEKSEKKKLKF